MSQASENFDDRRSTPRTATTLRGKVFPGAVDCVIADFSKRGARVRFSGPPPAGDRLIVVVWTSGFAYEAVIRWRTGFEIGVHFASNRDLRRPAPAHMAEAQAAWRHRRPRIRRQTLLKQNTVFHRTDHPAAPAQAASATAMNPPPRTRDGTAGS